MNLHNLNKASLIKKLPRVTLRNCSNLIQGNMHVRQDLSRCNLRGYNLDGKNLTGANLTNADLSNSSGLGVVMTNVIAPGIKLTNSTYKALIAGGADFRGGDFHNFQCGTRKITINSFQWPIDCYFYKANLERAAVTNGFYLKANFSEGKLKYANLNNSNLEAVNFNYADLSYITANTALLQSVTAIKANISYSVINDVKHSCANYYAANLTNASWNIANISKVNFSSTKRQGFKLTKHFSEPTVCPVFVVKWF